MSFLKKIFFKKLIVLGVLFSPSTFCSYSINEVSNENKEQIDALKFIDFDDFYNKGYFNVDASSGTFVLKGFNLDKKTNIQTDIDTNGYNAFYIPKYVTSISSSAEYANIGAFQYAFSNQTSNQQYISNKITSIIFAPDSTCSLLGKYCFDHCNIVNYVSLSNSISSLGDHCFSSCLSLSTVLLSNSLKTIPWCCFGCYSSETKLNNLTISIPEGVETIDRAAFEACRFDSITFPSTIKSINESAFKNVAISSMDFMTIDDSKIASMSFNSSWADGITPLDSKTNKIKVFLPKGKSSKYTSISNFVFSNQQINDGLIYKNAFVDNSVVKLNNTDKYLNFNLYPNKDKYADYMDSTAIYDFSCESTNRDVVIPNLSNDDTLQGKLNVFLLKKGSSQIKITETCDKLTLPLNFLDCFIDYVANSILFKDVEFNSYSLKPTDSPITTRDLNENVYDSFDEKISDVKFSIVDTEKKTYTLPDWITLNESTGSLKISPNTYSESILDIRIKVEQTSTGLIGYSDQFSIIIQNDGPTPKATKLIIDYDFFTIVAKSGDSVSTPSLTSYIITDTGESITSGVNFSIQGEELPDGLSFDSATGQITGTLTSQSKSCYNISIYASAKVESETLSGESGLFSIVVTDSPIQPTKLLINENIRTIYTKPNQSVKTSSLNESVTTNTSVPVTTGLNFSCDNLPTGFSIDNSTGIISCSSVPSNAQDAIDLQVHVSAIVDSISLEGDSNYFSIIINPDIQPTKLIIDNDFQTLFASEGQTISTFDLTNSIVTEYWSPVTTPLTFSCSSNLPLGLRFDTQTGQISGTIQAGAVSSANIQITVETSIDGKDLYGYSNYFSIIINNTPAIPTKLLFRTSMYNVSTFTGKVVSIDQDLLDNIITDTGFKVNADEHQLKFTLNGELPLGLSFDQATGKISGKIFLGAISSTKLSITATANYDGNTLTGESNSFNIIVNNKAPTPKALLVNYDMGTYYVNTNDEFASPSLIHYVSTDLHDEVSTNLIFSTTATLPKGLEIDKTTGAIYGKVIEDTISSKNFELEIYVETTIDGKVLQGKTNTFIIVLNQDKATKWGNVTLLIISLMLAPVCLAAIDTIISLTVKHLLVKTKNKKSKKH